MIKSHVDAYVALKECMRENLEKTVQEVLSYYETQFKYVGTVRDPQSPQTDLPLEQA
jgi:hypothetical protein